ncbi:NAD(P)/FAD-dependent oxidoreductase [Luteipulveratus mongoliensis]|uniref:FAD-dependent oxidoreductase n=1 Tax=Luteipulveratus mongoliensis TaxID=571913 RepID=A0A0K1JKY2_9MICO|nr:FAD-dependent oxidoreductase [Luteipulveratus mongoliensis]AKU17389.1 FAD-dependent oxidoreductase [Luteipulveratus mongoliensis]
MISSAVSALADAEPAVFWLADPAAPEPTSALVGDTKADLVVVGGGYTGLWTALQAKEDDPGRDVVLLEGRTVGWAASGRNGGFCAASLTHGEANGLSRYPAEFDRLQEMGGHNLDGIEDTLLRYGIDAEFERTGELDVAVADWQVDELRELADLLAAHGGGARLLDQDRTRDLVASPTYLAGLYDPEGVALVHPAKLAWGLRRACLDIGVRVHEHSPVTGLERDGVDVRVRTAYAAVRARQIALGTNVFTGLLRRLRHYIVPVYDYVLVTEPLSPQQRATVGWQGRQGLSDAGNQFHYYRLTADNRILWGGYDAVYHRGGQVRTEYDQRPATYATLAQHFFETFPQLAGLRFTHRWGGAIDTCSRFSPFWGTAYDGRLAYAVGYTGLGVGSSRFGARVMLDLLSGADTERTRLEMVRRKPLPFPPEPARTLAIRLTQKAIEHADQHAGHRNLWLRTLDRMGLGFDS